MQILPLHLGALAASDNRLQAVFLIQTFPQVDSQRTMAWAYALHHRTELGLYRPSPNPILSKVKNTTIPKPTKASQQRAGTGSVSGSPLPETIWVMSPMTNSIPVIITTPKPIDSQKYQERYYVILHWNARGRSITDFGKRIRELIVCIPQALLPRPESKAARPHHQHTSCLVQTLVQLESRNDGIHSKYLRKYTVTEGVKVLEIDLQVMKAIMQREPGIHLALPASSECTHYRWR